MPPTFPVINSTQRIGETQHSIPIWMRSMIIKDYKKNITEKYFIIALDSYN